MIFRDEIQISTSGHGQMTDLTSEIAEILRSSGIQDGIAHVFNIGSTGVIGTIEFEPGLQKDLPQILNELIPPGTHYGHEQTWNDGNAHSHLQATILGPEITVPISNGKPLLGTWQQIIHLECDNKPRQRRIVITAIGE